MQKFSSNHSQATPPARAAFTLVEVLVAIGILALLATILLMAMGPAFESAKINATKSTIALINTAIQDRVDAINRMDVSVEAKKLVALNSGLTLDQATFLIKNVLYRQALPQRTADLQGLDFGDTTTDNAPLYAVWNTYSGNVPTEQQNSALLYLALTRGGQLRAIPGGKSYSVPLLNADQINPRQLKGVVDLTGNIVIDDQRNPVVYFADAWEQPFRFYTWPTRLISDGTNLTVSSAARGLISDLSTDTSTTTSPLAKDPFNPKSMSLSVFAPTMGTTFNLTYAPSVTPLSCGKFDIENYRDIGVWHCPLLVSGGADEVIGLGEPNSGTATERLGLILNADSVYDNITNRQK